jgi:hypothetical protein
LDFERTLKGLWRDFQRTFKVLCTLASKSLLCNAPLVPFACRDARSVEKGDRCVAQLPRHALSMLVQHVYKERGPLETLVKRSKKQGLALRQERVDSSYKLNQSPLVRFDTHLCSASVGKRHAHANDTKPEVQIAHFRSVRKSFESPFKRLSRDVQKTLPKVQKTISALWTNLLNNKR